MPPEDRQDNSDQLTLDAARTNLSYIWFIGSGVLFFVLVIQSLLGKYSTDTQQVWSWYLPCVLPTLSLMVSVLGAGALGAGDQRNLRRGFFTLTVGLSVMYLIILATTIVVASFRTPAVDVLVVSSAYLSPLQGVVVAAIGYIFISKHALKR